jgi:hypothetical protein
VYFFWQGSPIQFKACAVFQLSIDFGASHHDMCININCAAAIVGQRIIYGTEPPLSVLLDDEDLEQALALAEE